VAGVQQVQLLATGPSHVLELSVNGGSYEHAGLGMRLELKGANLEFNTVA
jgi:hypothetical protein